MNKSQAATQVLIDVENINNQKESDSVAQINAVLNKVNTLFKQEKKPSDMRRSYLFRERPSLIDKKKLTDIREILLVPRHERNSAQ